MLLPIFQHNLSIVVVVGSNQQTSLFLKFFSGLWIFPDVLNWRGEYDVLGFIRKMFTFFTPVSLTTDWSVFFFSFFEKPCYYFEYILINFFKQFV